MFSHGTLHPATKFREEPKFNADNSGNIFYIYNNKKEFDEALKGFLRKVGQSMDECFQVHDYESFKFRLNKTL